MILTLRKPLAFLARDFIDDTSYKLAFALRFTNVFFYAFVFFFLSQLIEGASNPHLETYGGDYFSFALIGIAFTRFFSSPLNVMRRFIREAQLNGTLEALLSTQTGALTIVISSMLYQFLFTSMEVAVLFLLGRFLFQVDMYWANLPAALLVLFIGLWSFTSVGVIASGFIIIFKRGDPVTRLFTLGSQLLAGELYPISVLPVWLQFFSKLLPVTYALEGVRLALLQNYSVGQLSGQILALLAFAVVLVPASVVFFRYAVRRAKMDGSLAQY